MTTNTSVGDGNTLFERHGQAFSAFLQEMAEKNKKVVSSNCNVGGVIVNTNRLPECLLGNWSAEEEHKAQSAQQARPLDPLPAVVLDALRMTNSVPTSDDNIPSSFDARQPLEGSRVFSTAGTRSRSLMRG